MPVLCIPLEKPPRPALNDATIYKTCDFVGVGGGFLRLSLHFEVDIEYRSAMPPFKLVRHGSGPDHGCFIKDMSMRAAMAGLDDHDQIASVLDVAQCREVPMQDMHNSFWERTLMNAAASHGGILRMYIAREVECIRPVMFCELFHLDRSWQAKMFSAHVEHEWSAIVRRQEEICGQWRAIQEEQEGLCRFYDVGN
jgi:hypothetical protein